jgi:hypothetical protein
VSAPIDRAYIEILPDTRQFTSAAKREVDAAMNTVKTSVGNASKDISSKASAATNGLGAGAKANAASAAGALSGLRNTATGIFDKIKGGAKEAFNAFGGKQVAGLLAVGGLIEFGKKSTETFETVVKESLGLQRVMGGSVRSASEWRGAMQLGGVSADQFQIAVRKMSQQIVASAGGKGSAFDKLGLSVRDVHGNLKSMDDLLPLVADRFQQMAPGAEKNAAAVQLFGRAGLQLLPFLNRGSAGLQQLKDKANEFGIVIGDKQAAAVKKSIAAHREFQARMQGLQVSIGQFLLPVIDKFLELLNNYLFPALKLVG